MECEETRNEMVERDFYNWLTHDTRSRSHSETRLSTEELHEYYMKNQSSLGLQINTNIDDNLRRTKSLSECYKSQWWKLTSKSFISWVNIHNHLRMYHDDFIFIWDHFKTPGTAAPSLGIDLLGVSWRLPDLKQKLRIINRFSIDELKFFHGEWLLTNEPMLLSVDLMII